MKIDVVSIFGAYLDPLHLSLVGKAIETGLVELGVHDLRDWTTDRHRTVDDTPYGGGPGMVMRPEPWGRALDALAPANTDPRLVVLTPSGRRFTQPIAAELAAEPHLILACGRYEGFDARVVEYAAGRMRVDELSIGDYVLNGGEAAALVLIEAVVRLLPGVIGNPASLTEESHSAEHQGLLEYPLYTKPPLWRGLAVPEILFSGHHAKIAEWRQERAVARTRAFRPDLLPEDLLITPAAAVDAGELLTLQRAAYLSEGRLNGTFELPPLVQSLAELRASLDVDSVLVGRRGGRLVGSVRGAIEDEAWSVSRLMVAPDLQGLGIGSALLTVVEGLAPAGTPVLRVVAGAASAGDLGFFRRRGYVEVARIERPAGVPVVVLEREVNQDEGL